MKTIDDIEKLDIALVVAEELLEANNGYMKQSAKDAETIDMLVDFIEDIQYLVAAMPTFMRKIEKILDYADESEKLQKFLRKYREEKNGTDS
jgi:hypothetical protein